MWASPCDVGAVRSTVLGVALFGLSLPGCGPILYPAPEPPRAPVASGLELIRLRGDSAGWGDDSATIAANDPEDGEAPRADAVALWAPPSPGRSVVVFFHGNAALADDMDWLASSLVAHGEGALLVEYPGYGRAPGAPSEASIYDTSARLLDELARRGVDRAHTLLVGQSLGSAVAVEMAVRGYGGRLLLISPFTSVPDLCDGIVPFGLAGVFAREPFDTFAKARHLRIPTVVAEGDADLLVPLEMATEVAERIPGARLEVFAGGGHNDLFAREDGRLLRLIAELASPPARQ